MSSVTLLISVSTLLSFFFLVEGPIGTVLCSVLFFFLTVKTPASGDADIKKKEESIMELGNMLAKNKQTEELRKVLFFLSLFSRTF